MHVLLGIFSFLQFARQYKSQHPFRALFRRLIQKSLLRTGNSSKIVDEIELVTFKVHSPLRQDESRSNDRPINTPSPKGKQASDLNEATNFADRAFPLSGNEGHSDIDDFKGSSIALQYHARHNEYCRCKHCISQRRGAGLELFARFSYRLQTARRLGG